ncbi:MAG: hypothetical protein IPL53_11165 [Ignavibacteria bacterium]|nr:hypothetical protein [Ignavibacteria bacterium]
MNKSITLSKISGIFIVNLLVFCSVLIFFSEETFAQDTESINLYDLQNNEIQVSNREMVFENSGDKKYISLSRNRGDALIWLPAEEFQNGTIEVVMRGIDEYQRSFIGIAFHGTNDSTFDAVYCRPFNFLAEDSIRRIRAIQYVSHPEYGWEKLRTEQTGVFENKIIDPPDPKGWFKMKLVIDDKTVKAFINDNETPSLVVEKLSDRTSGKIGIFVADNSGGDFETVRIIRKYYK